VHQVPDQDYRAPVQQALLADPLDVDALLL